MKNRDFKAENLFEPKKDIDMDMAKQSNEFIEIYLIEKMDVNNYSVEEILNILNLEGENFRVVFKKGKTHYYEDKSIVCKCKKLHLKKAKKPDSLSAEERKKKSLK